MQPESVVDHTIALQPCVVVDRGGLTHPSVASQRDRELAAEVVRLGDVVRRVARSLGDREGSGAAIAGLSEMVALVATTADGVPNATLLHVLPDPAQLATSRVPEICVPVVDGAGGPGGHLHLETADDHSAPLTRRATVDFLAGYAVDLWTGLERERKTLDALALAQVELDSARNDVEHLTRALASNRQIGVAIGILVAVQQVTQERAFDLLREVSQTSNRKLHDVADDVVLTGVLPSLPAQRTTATPRARTRAYRPRTGDADPLDDAGRRFQLTQTVERDRIDLHLRGELDLAARDELLSVLDRLAELPLPVHCYTDDVTFADSHGLGPVVADSRRRQHQGRGPLVLVRPNPMVQRLVGLLIADVPGREA